MNWADGLALMESRRSHWIHTAALHTMQRFTPWQNARACQKRLRKYVSRLVTILIRLITLQHPHPATYIIVVLPCLHLHIPLQPLTARKLPPTRPEARRSSILLHPPNHPSSRSFLPSYYASTRLRRITKPFKTPAPPSAMITVPTARSLKYINFKADSSDDLTAFSEVFEDESCPNYFWNTADPEEDYRQARSRSTSTKIVLRYNTGHPGFIDLNELDDEEVEEHVQTLRRWGSRVGMRFIDCGGDFLTFKLESGRYYNTAGRSSRNGR